MTPQQSQEPGTPSQGWRRRSVLTGLGGLAGVAALSAAASGCSIQIRSEPDPTIGRDTMLINADKGSPLFDRNFNPYLTTKRTASTWIYEPLILVNPLDGSRTPWLAESWDLPDARTVVLTVRAARWSDGRDLTAEDVAFTFDLLKRFPALDLKGAWQRLESVETDGDRVVLRLLGEDAPALSVLGQTLVLPEHLWSDVADPTSWRNPDPVGTGPFLLGNYNPQQYSMDRNPDYWRAEDVVIAHLILPATNSQLDTVTRGYDWSYSYISDVEGTWGAASPDNLWWFPPAGVIALVPNLTVAPFDDVDVRRGISLALDRAAIAASATEGYMEPAGQTGLILPNQLADLDPTIPDQGLVTQDRDAALESFGRAGFTLSGDTLLDAQGRPLEFDLLSANGYADWTRAAQEVQRQLLAVGIRVRVQLPQPAGYQAAVNNGEYQVALAGMGGGDLFAAFDNLLSSRFYAPVGQATQNNVERFRDPAVDALLDRWRASLDPAEQQQLSHALQNVVYDQLPVIGLYYGGSWGLFSDRKFVGWPSASDPYMAPQNYDQAPLGIFVRLRLAGSTEGARG
ncbi:ABC transporter substrate-binding protein [Kineococcus gynurae]|uniref:ABC transporter substrate-binding protein n=1 Tax=Kineococcus gynurae TaxID=452979 RepID=A0ABV5LPC8_9ACTN